MSIATRINEMSSHIEQAYDELQGLGADLSNVNKNIENISIILDNIYDNMPQVSGEGTSLTLDDTKVGKIKSTLKGNTSQNGAPTPSSPIPVNIVSGDNEINIVGKNLLDIDTINFKPSNYTITKANNNYTYTVSSSGTWWQAPNYKIINIQPNTQYTYSFNVSNLSITSGRNSRVLIDQINSNGEVISVPGTNHYIDVDSIGAYSKTFTTTANTRSFIVRVYVETGVSTANTYVTLNNFMLEKDSSATLYKPYQVNTYNIDLPVENLFNDSTLNNKWVAQNGTITSATGANCIKYNCNTNDTYTLSATFGTSSPNNIIVMAFYNSSDTLLNRYVATTNTSLTMTYTAPANTSYMYAGHYGIVPTTIQLEKGSKQNSFTPYGTTPIEMCSSPDGTIRDSFLHDKALDRWYLHKEIRKIDISNYNNTEPAGAWSSFEPNGNICMTYYNTGVKVTPIRNDVLSNKFTPQSESMWNGMRIGIQSYANDSKIVIGATIAEVEEYAGITLNVNNYIENFKNYIVSLSPDIYIILANPTNTEITYQPLIDQLNELEKAISYENQTNIFQINNDLPFIIKASALKKND